MDGQGYVCADAAGGLELGDMEGQWNGIIAVGLRIYWLGVHEFS